MLVGISVSVDYIKIIQKYSIPQYRYSLGKIIKDKRHLLGDGQC